MQRVKIQGIVGIVTMPLVTLFDFLPLIDIQLFFLCLYT